MIDYSLRTACTCGPLVYLRTLKCASTFFWNSFSQFGWIEIAFDKIDWQTQRVFSHILDPNIRRIKGIAEFVWMNHTQDQLTDPAYRTFVQQTPVLDAHTVSYYENFGDRCDQIDWIPISDTDHQTAADLTSQMLFENGIKIFNRWSWQDRHSGEADKKLIAQQVAKCLATVYTPAVDAYLHQDWMLYQRVLNRFNPDGRTWAKVSWLR
jgi:hypothetical protein